MRHIKMQKKHYLMLVIFVLVTAALLTSIYFIDKGIQGITGQAVGNQIVDVPNTENIQPEVTQELEENILTGVCSGFGFVRKKTNPDGSIEEYCYDPCNGNEDCIADFNNIEEVDFVGGTGVPISTSSSTASPTSSIETQDSGSPTGSSTGSSGGGGRTPSKKRA